MTEEHPSCLNIFIGYAQEDQRDAETLEKHLLHLKQPDLTTWHSGKVRLGEKWDVAVDDALNQASLILLVISADFFASNFCLDLMQHALERHKQGEALVIPVLLRSVFLPASPFADLPVLPHNRKPIREWQDRDEAFYDVIKGIQSLSQKIPSSKLRQPNNRLREARLQRGWSPTDLAKKMNTTSMTISRWEHGESVPSPYNRQRLSEVFGKDANELGLTLLFQEYMGSSFVREQGASSPEKAGSSFIREQAVPHEVSPRSLSKGKSTYHQSLGKVLLTLGQYEHALFTYERALLHEPRNTTLLLGKGEALLGLKRSQEALTVYEQVLFLDPASSRAYQGRGNVYEFVAQQVFDAMKREAQECFEKAMQLDPQHKEFIAENVVFDEVRNTEKPKQRIETANKSSNIVSIRGSGLNYKRGLAMLKQCLRDRAEEEIVTLESHLLTNLKNEHLYGADPVNLVERAIIVSQLNVLAQQYCQESFDDMCE